MGREEEGDSRSVYVRGIYGFSVSFDGTARFRSQPCSEFEAGL